MTAAGWITAGRTQAAPLHAALTSPLPALMSSQIEDRVPYSATPLLFFAGIKITQRLTDGAPVSQMCLSNERSAG